MQTSEAGSPHWLAQFGTSGPRHEHCPGQVNCTLTHMRDAFPTKVLQQRSQTETGHPWQSRGGTRAWSWGYGKTTLLQEYELPVQTGARSDDLAETHPTEGMTKVIPALSCKHDNEERRSGSDDYLARRQLLRQRGGIQTLRAFRRAFK